MVFFDNIPGGGVGGGKGVFANLDPDIYREMGRLRSEGKLGFVKVQ